MKFVYSGDLLGKIFEVMEFAATLKIQLVDLISGISLNDLGFAS